MSSARIISSLLIITQLSESQVINLRVELQEEIMAKMVPENIISNVTRHLFTWLVLSLMSFLD